MDLETAQELQEIGGKIQQHLYADTDRNTGTLQYKLLLPRYLADELQQFAKSRGMTVADTIRFAIRLMLTIVANLPPGAQLIIHEEDKPDRYIILPL